MFPLAISQVSDYQVMLWVFVFKEYTMYGLKVLHKKTFCRTICSTTTTPNQRVIRKGQFQFRWKQYLNSMFHSNYTNRLYLTIQTNTTLTQCNVAHLVMTVLFILYQTKLYS